MARSITFMRHHLSGERTSRRSLRPVQHIDRRVPLNVLYRENIERIYYRDFERSVFCYTCSSLRNGNDSNSSCDYHKIFAATTPISAPTNAPIAVPIIVLRVLFRFIFCISVISKLSWSHKSSLLLYIASVRLNSPLSDICFYLLLFVWRWCSICFVDIINSRFVIIESVLKVLHFSYR